MHQDPNISRNSQMFRVVAAIRAIGLTAIAPCHRAQIQEALEALYQSDPYYLDYDWDAAKWFNAYRDANHDSPV